MNAQDFSRLSVGITYRFDIKKMLLSQLGALLGLVGAMASEGNPPFGDKPFELLSPVTIFVLINLFVLGYTLLSFGSSTIKLFPSMLIYDSRRRQTRIDFNRVVRAVSGSNKDLQFYIADSSGKEILGLRIKNCGVYSNSNEMMAFLKHILKDKFSSASAFKIELMTGKGFTRPTRFLRNKR